MSEMVERVVMAIADDYYAPQVLYAGVEPREPDSDAEIDRLANAVADVLLSQDSRAYDLGDDLTEFMVFIPLDLRALAQALRLRGMTFETCGVRLTSEPG